MKKMYRRSYFRNYLLLVSALFVVILCLPGCSGGSKNTSRETPTEYSKPFNLSHSPDGTRVAYMIYTLGRNFPHEPLTTIAINIRIVNTDGTGDVPIYSDGPIYFFHDQIGSSLGSGTACVP